jgi:hypothetical protein
METELRFSLATAKSKNSPVSHFQTTVLKQVEWANECFSFRMSFIRKGSCGEPFLIF